MRATDQPTETTRYVDRVCDLETFESDSTPTIVQISDIHGYLESARSALLAVGDVEEFDPIVELDAAGKLHWAGGTEFVLVFNGDVIDRGPANDECLELVWRLQREAPPGHVRYHLGNHEMAILLPEVVHWPRWYSGTRPDSVRREFYERVLEDRVSVAFEGYEFTYSHAGAPDEIAASELNRSLRTAAETLLEAVDGTEFRRSQRDVADRFSAVFGMGETTGREPGAGVLWLDYRYMPEDAPPQVVGHTRHRKPTRDGDVICGNVIRKNEGSIGGEGVIVETPDRIGVVVRKEDRSASCTFFP
ncbi:metallophosphoesterase [Halobacteria archaeon AArc-m2/3/4]|uniref:Metallophosphoesterase n=1 Tax=Natronoglomus mannanivorans TaxID=2979990 RepID=A0AAP3E4H4_9EURY|nr:metallophosphoesterase [Halobacteria archaeon AArc-xg1-1]MCU4975722.1 metallophosphoesterase [Halobacteria archaeon AArc-m2/3/4]